MLAKTKKTVLAAAALGAAVIMLTGCTGSAEPTHQDGAPIQTAEPADAVLSAEDNHKVIITDIGENIATLDFATFEGDLAGRMPADFETEGTVVATRIEVPFEGGCAYDESLAAAKNVFERPTNYTGEDGKYGPGWTLRADSKLPEWVDEAGAYHGQLVTSHGLTNYADVLVTLGWARYSDTELQTREQLKLQTDAQEQGLGAWGICGDSWR